MVLHEWRAAASAVRPTGNSHSTSVCKLSPGVYLASLGRRGFKPVRLLTIPFTLLDNKVFEPLLSNGCHHHLQVFLGKCEEKLFVLDAPVRVAKAVRQFGNILIV
mmetsp:Transcript_93525/g.136618  ORF Transcript_93525/g.136618 Transcript_93525/m.136618 type:complete len:105 (+) Transcript_93525:508-822(+)